MYSMEFSMSNSFIGRSISASFTNILQPRKKATKRHLLKGPLSRILLRRDLPIALRSVTIVSCGMQADLSLYPSAKNSAETINPLT